MARTHGKEGQLRSVRTVVPQSLAGDMIVRVLLGYSPEIVALGPRREASSWVWGISAILFCKENQLRSVPTAILRSLAVLAIIIQSEPLGYSHVTTVHGHSWEA